MSDAIRLRASSLAELLDCPARWYARHPAFGGGGGPTSGRARLGTAVHASTAAFDQVHHLGEDGAQTVDEAVGVAVDAIWSPEEEVRWGGEEPRQRDAERIAARLTTTYCLDVSPVHRFTAVEKRCEEVRMDMGGGVVFLLTGTLDRVREEAGGRGIADVKTGARAVDSDGHVSTRWHGAQLAEYELLELLSGEPITLPPVILGLNTETGAAGVGRMPKAPHSVLLGNPDEGEPGMLDVAAAIIRGGLWWGNARSTLCSPKYCPAWSGCRWKFTEEDGP